MKVVAVVASLILTLLAAIVGLAKVQRLPASGQVRDQAAISPRLWLASGWVELVAAAALVLGIFMALELALGGALLLLVSYLALALRQLTRGLGVAAVMPAASLSVLSAVTVASITASG